MNKSELIESIANTAQLTKADASRALDAFISTVTTTLQKEDPITLVGFGTFKISNRSARVGRNPRTGEPIQIKASKTVKFNTGKELKEAIN